jgi:hypothetical protein
MQQARAFLLVCAGLLCLALAYHLGARSAGAHSGTFTAADCDAYSWEFSAVMGRTVCILYEGGGRKTTVAGIPGTAPVVACSYQGGRACVVLDNGDCYDCAIGGAVYPWTFRGNLLGGAVSAQGTTWGQVKARYATPQGSAEDLGGR